MRWKSRWMLLGAANVALATIVPAVAWAAVRNPEIVNVGCMNCHGFWACLRCAACAVILGVPC